MLKSASVLAAAALSAAGFAGFAGSASAQTISPPGASFTLTGNLTLSQSTTVTCAVTLNGVVNSSGTGATITGGSFAPGSWQCGWLVVPTGFPWAVTPGINPSRITVTGIAASSIAGSCSGTITAPWNNGPPSSVTFSSNSIPGSPNACTISGTLTSTPTLTIP
jgi:hypothetical protein